MQQKWMSLAVLGVLCNMATMSSGYTEDEVNDDFDKILKQLSKMPRKLRMVDPLHLPDVIGAKHKFQNITVTGMSDLYRSKDTIFKAEPKSQPAITQITASAVNITAAYTTKLLFFEVNGDVSFVFEDLPITLLLTMGKSGTKVSLINIDRNENYYIRYNGWLMMGSLNVALKDSLQNARDTLLGELEEQFAKAFEHDLNKAILQLK